MFEWKVEEMKLMNSQNKISGIFNCEYEVSREDKIEFVDSMQDGKLSYIIGMILNFEEIKDTLPKDQYGEVKTVSLKAWLRKNDTFYNRPIFDNDYNYGGFYLLGVKRYISINPMNTKGSYCDHYADLVDEVFHRQLIECCSLEKKYFREHDEYSILKDRFCYLNDEYRTSFGVHTGYCSNGEVYVYDDENSEHREITIEELKRLIPLYDRLEMFIQELSEEVKDIKY